MLAISSKNTHLSLRKENWGLTFPIRVASLRTGRGCPYPSASQRGRGFERHHHRLYLCRFKFAESSHLLWRNDSCSTVLAAEVIWRSFPELFNFFRDLMTFLCVRYSVRMFISSFPLQRSSRNLSTLRTMVVQWQVGRLGWCPIVFFQCLLHKRFSYLFRFLQMTIRSCLCHCICHVRYEKQQSCKNSSLRNGALYFCGTRNRLVYNVICFGRWWSIFSLDQSLIMFTL